MDTTRQRRHQQKNHKASSRSSSPVRSVPYHTHHPHHQPASASTSAPAKSRWQQLVVGAGSAAGTTAAVISEDSMKCLKYCLSWLKYAIQHIEQQMATIKNFLISLASKSTSSSSSLSTTNNNNGDNRRSVLSNIKKDIVETLRKVVEVITKYAGASLPFQSRQMVRGFILNLPGKWASLNDIRSSTNSPIGSPMLGPRSNNGITTSTSRASESRETESAVRLLDFGQESVDMLSSVSTVFSDTVDRAELWIDRLKMVPGMGNTSNVNKDTLDNNDNMMLDGESVRLPPIRTLDQPNHSPFDRNQDFRLDPR